jgi:hypothetical protein
MSETVTEARPSEALRSFTPLILDAGVPVASYYLLTGVAGMGTVAALAWSSVVPAARTLWGIVRERRLNGLATLILTVNVVSLVLSTLTGDPRLMLAKDGAVSSTIGIGILVSVFLGKPMMTSALKPWFTKGDGTKDVVWHRMLETSAEFRRAERTFSVVWGIALLAECAARVVGAYTIPVGTMVWLGSVFLVVTIFGAIVVSGRLAAGPMEKMLAAELESDTRELQYS